MGKSVNLIFTGVIAALLMCQSGLAEDLQAKAPNKTFSVASAEEAIGRALEYTGFDKSKGFSIEESIGEVKWRLQEIR